MSDEQNEKLKFKLGDRVKTPKGLGTIKGIPNSVYYWVNLDDCEWGYKQEELELYVEQKDGGIYGKNDLDQSNLKPTNNPFLASIKKDDNKYDPTMLTIEMVELVSRVRQFGAKKYARNNFKITGFKYTRSLAAALRHIFAFLNGEDNDPESGLSHLGHAICSLEHCIYDTKNHPENDDRKS